MRCFIIGNGPSLNKHDLTKLKDEVTFGCNRIYLKYKEMGFAVTFYFCVDSIMPIVIRDDILRYIQAKELREAAIIRTFQDFFKVPKVIFIDGSYSVGIDMVLSAQKGGYNPIYLIGVDLDYNYPQKSDRIILKSIDDFPIADGEKDNLKKVRSYVNMSDVFVLERKIDDNHFSMDYLKNIPAHYDIANTIIEEYKNSIGNIPNVINAGIGGNCDFFPRVDYDSLFSD